METETYTENQETIRALGNMYMSMATDLKDTDTSSFETFKRKAVACFKQINDLQSIADIEAGRVF